MHDSRRLLLFTNCENKIICQSMAINGYYLEYHLISASFKQGDCQFNFFAKSGGLADTVTW